MSARRGYTFLLSVLFIGAIVLAVTGSMLLFGWLTLRNTETVERSSGAFELAMTCAEYGLMELMKDSNYSGNEVLENERGTCDILPTGGAGNENRTICTEGMSGDVTRRIEIIVERLLPSVRVYAWQEVEFFSSCSYE